jgi:hypothetical protein
MGDEGKVPQSRLAEADFNGTSVTLQVFRREFIIHNSNKPEPLLKCRNTVR